MRIVLSAAREKKAAGKMTEGGKTERRGRRGRRGVITWTMDSIVWRLVMRLRESPPSSS